MIFDVESILAELDIKHLRSNDQEIRCVCPAHFERTGKRDSVGDWSINRDTGQHYCFSCQFGGASVISLVAYVLDVGIVQAKAWVREHGMSELELVQYEEAGWQRKRAKRRVERIEESETLDESHLSIYSDVPDKWLHSRALDRDAVDLYEVVWSMEHDGWILPIRMADETLLGYQLKPTNGDAPRNYPSNMMKSLTLFGIDKFRTEDRAYLVESPLDAVRLFSCGYVGAVAAFGAGVSDEQLSLLVEYFDSVVVALDNDNAGMRGATKIWNGYRQRLHLSFLNYNGTMAKDVGDMTDREIHEAIDTATPMPLRRVV